MIVLMAKAQSSVHYFPTWLLSCSRTGKTLNLIHAYFTSFFALAASTSGASVGFGSGVVEGNK